MKKGRSCPPLVIATRFINQLRFYKTSRGFWGIPCLWKPPWQSTHGNSSNSSSFLPQPTVTFCAHWIRINLSKARTNIEGGWTIPQTEFRNGEERRWENTFSGHFSKPRPHADLCGYSKIWRYILGLFSRCKYFRVSVIKYKYAFADICGRRVLFAEMSAKSNFLCSLPKPIDCITAEQRVIYSLREKYLAWVCGGSVGKTTFPSTFKIQECNERV